MESVGFKEWDVVCQALGRGRQTVILRKGGIAEGRPGFSFRHQEFFLFPTWFHGASEKVRDGIASEPVEKESENSVVAIKFAARVEESLLVTDWAMAESLEPFHILREEVVRQRFEYEQTRGIHVALVRTFRLQPSWRLPNEKRYGGCRSWVELPNPPSTMRLEPVLDDATHEQRRKLFGELTRRAHESVRST